MEIDKKDKTTIGDVEKWITKCKSLYSLQRIRAWNNKKIKSITSQKEKSPFDNIPIEQKREIIKELYKKEMKE